MRDLFFMTPGGAILARPASRQREMEPRYAAHALALAEVPIVRTVIGKGHFEGADALWMSESKVLLGIGQRTNAAGAKQVEAVLRDMNVETIQVEVPTAAQHLLGAVSFIDRNLAILHPSAINTRLSTMLTEQSVELLHMTGALSEFDNERGMNFVAVQPKTIVMPAGCPRLSCFLRQNGITVYEVGIQEFARCAGGVACLTAIVHRDTV